MRMRRVAAALDWASLPVLATQGMLAGPGLSVGVREAGEHTSSVLHLCSVPACTVWCRHGSWEGSRHGKSPAVGQQLLCAAASHPRQAAMQPAPSPAPLACAQPCRRGRAVPQVPHFCGHWAGLCAAFPAVGVPHRAAGVPAAVAGQRCKHFSTAAAVQQHAVAAATARWGSGQGSRWRHWARIKRSPLLAAAAPADLVGTWVRLGSQQGAGRLGCCRAAIAAAGVAPAAICMLLVFLQLVFPTCCSTVSTIENSIPVYD